MTMTPDIVIAIRDTNAHLIDVTLTYICTSKDALFRMPVWTPGSYMVREYARHVRDVQATVDGAAQALARYVLSSFMRVPE